MSRRSHLPQIIHWKHTFQNHGQIPNGLWMRTLFPDLEQFIGIIQMDFSAEHNGAKNKTTERNKTWILQLEYSSYNKCINCFGKTQQKLPDLKNCQPFLSGPIWIFSNFLVSSSNFTSSGTEWIFKGFYGHFSTIPSQLWPPVVIACYIIHPRTRH